MILRYKSVKYSAGIAALALIATACGSSTSTTSTTPTTATSSSAGASTGPSGTAASSAAPESSGSSASSMQALYAAAKANNETQVVIYGPVTTANIPVYDQFSKEFPGIKVVASQVLGPALVSRVQGEMTSGKHVGDLTDTGSATTLQFLAQGDYQPMGIDTSTIDPLYVGPDNMFFADTLSPFVVIYNTQRLSPDKAPKNWHGLVDASLKGNMVISDPTINGPSMDIFANMVFDGRYTQDFVKQFATTVKPQLVVAPPLVEQAVATGQKWIGFPDTLVAAEQAKQKGAPLGIIFPMDDGSYFAPTYAALLKNAPHPNAAKLLLTWELSKAGQQALANNFQYSAVKGSPAPDGFPAREKIDLLKVIPLDQNEALDKAQLAQNKMFFTKG
jgi:iron(III) transport system substrate-binding protein